MPIQKLLPAGSTIPSAQHNQRISELSRSPIGFGSNVSLSTLHLLCYRRRCKTRYVVIWLIFYDGAFTRKKQYSFSQRTVYFTDKLNVISIKGSVVTFRGSLMRWSPPPCCSKLTVCFSFRRGHH
ncbi:hypothetical protein, partial [Xenorhabdus bovienii]|uniref:hypothetical protein n=1 Tax=Xenorhabdus bovienii TaxID=40576 RepID=UPI001E2F7DF1